MPGLIRGVARTAVVAGTATHVSNNVSRRQAGRWAEQQPQQQPQPQAAPPAPAPASNPMDDKIAQLKELGELKAQGILTDAEFEAQKAKLLA
ncbi:MAG: SHOCT domain-containing protein [Actinomycetes bacterium]